MFDITIPWIYRATGPARMQSLVTTMDSETKKLGSLESLMQKKPLKIAFLRDPY